MARGHYYGGGHTRGGRTEPSRRGRKITIAQTRKYIAELNARLDAAETDEQRRLIKKSLTQHEADLAAGGGK